MRIHALAAAVFFVACQAYAGQVPNPANITGSPNAGDILISGGGQNITSGGGNASSLLVTPTGVNPSYAETLANIAAQSGVLLDTFQKDGASDTVALTRACSAGVPVLLGSRTYIINDFSCSTSPFVLRGVPGVSIIQRAAAATSAWLHINSAAVFIDGVTFDANKASVSANQWGVLLNAGGQTAYVAHSVFKNNSGTLGAGFALTSTGPGAGGSFTFEDNEVTGNTFNSAFFGSVTNGRIVGNYVHDNTASGILVSSNSTATGTNYSSDILVSGNRTSGNVNGIVVGGIGVPYNFSQNWPAISIQVSNNSSWDNSSAQIVNQGQNVDILNNQILQVNASSVTYGILCNSSHGKMAGNNINLPNSTFGIDCGGAIEPQIFNNHITVAVGTALDVGGTQNTTVKSNVFDISGIASAIFILGTEGDGNGIAFPTTHTGLVIEQNQFNLSGSSAVGISIHDNAGGFTGAVGTIVNDNDFNFSGGAGISAGLTFFAKGTALQVFNNRVNGIVWQFQDPTATGDITFNVLFDRIQTISSAVPIRSIVSDYIGTFNGGGSILYIFPTSQGSGYSAATVINITCSTTNPTGGSVIPLLNSGNLIGVKIATMPTGCVGTPAATASDSGGGSGAVLVASATPVLPANKTLIFQPATSNLLERGGGAVSINGLTGSPFLATGASITLSSGFSGGTIWTVLSQPALTSFPLTSGSFTGSISGTTLTTSALTGTLAIGQTIFGSGVSNFTTITAGSGTSWTVNISQNVSSEAMTSTGLPGCTSATTTGTNGAQILVSGSSSGAWQARCNGTNWIDPTGATIN